MEMKGLRDCRTRLKEHWKIISKSSQKTSIHNDDTHNLFYRYLFLPSGPSENTPMDCSTLDKTILYSLGTLILFSLFGTLFGDALSSLFANALSSLFANASDRLNIT